MSDADKVGAAEEFHCQFRKKSAEISSSIPKPTTDLDALTSLRQQLRQLEMEVIDAQLYLPAYDQKRYIQEIKDLADQIAARQVQLKPKSKFQFKRSTAINAPSNQSNQIIRDDSKSNRHSMESVPLANELSAASVPTHSPNTDAAELYLQKGTMIRSVSNKIYHFSPRSQQQQQEALDLSIEDCSDCIIDLLQHSAPISAIHIARLTRCIVIAKPILGSIMISDCNQCVFVLACHQFRMHNSQMIDNYLHITCHPIIEDCSKIQFAPLLPQWYESGAEETSATSQLVEGSQNLYDKVDDFNWLKKTSSPNWQLMPEDRQRLFLAEYSLYQLLSADSKFPQTLQSQLAERFP